MLRVLVKGTQQEATSAARERGIPVIKTEPYPNPRWNKSWIYTYPAFEESVALWFSEQAVFAEGVGAPPGTATWYQPVPEEGTCP